MIRCFADVDDEDMHKYIEREMLTLRQMRHPNIVQVGLALLPILFLLLFVCALIFLYISDHVNLLHVTIDDRSM
tara:strand:+ start:412 stop:633 length:222 start_codon:yes stop_codon:yes gene_type:complete